MTPSSICQQTEYTAGVVSGRQLRRRALRDEAGMATEFNGKIELDIRDSEPDWGPYAAPTAPDGAPNVLYLVWDDTGIATWDCFGGLVEMPTMSRIAERGVRLSQFHTTALCSPTRASLLTGRNPTTVGMATIEEFTGRLPRLQRAHSRRHRAAVRGARRTRVQHLLRRQVAPDAAGGVESGVHQTTLAAVAGFRAVLRLHGRRDRSVVSRSGLRQSSRGATGDCRRRVTTCQRISRTRQSSSSATRR